jgi:hypothetical protein
MAPPPTPPRHQASHRPQRIGAIAAASLVLVALPTGPVTGAAVHASVAVSARVLAVAKIVRSSIPDTVRVSAQDVRRGFSEAPPAELVVMNNSPAGFSLELMPRTGYVRSMKVEGLGADVALDAEGGSIVARNRHGTDIELELGFRFALAKGTVPGVYPFPFAVSVRPIEP